jgi:RNA polymerase sigma factor (sigma-70 family)
MKNGGSVDDAKEIFQEGIMILLKNVDDNNFTLICKLKTYLFSICNNLWKSELLKKRTEENYHKRKVEEEHVVDFTENQDYELREKIFYCAFETLDFLHQKILNLSWQDYSLKEIADELGYTVNYVKKEKCIGKAELVRRVKSNKDYKLIMDSD